MKRIVIYILALAAALLVPLRGTDVGKLLPVGLIQLYKEGENIVIVTDTGDSGSGSSVQAAFLNLEETTAGVVFLDTADYLLVSRSAEDAVPTLKDYLKPTVRVCYAEADIDPVQAAEFLEVHRPAVRLKEHGMQNNVQTLSSVNGRLILR